MATEQARTNILSRSPFEPLRGYSRAVQAGDTLYISGTTAMNYKGEVTAPGDAYEQTKAILHSIKTILTSSTSQFLASAHTHTICRNPQTRHG